MRRLSLRSGFSAVEIVLIVAIIAIIGFLGYTFYTSYQNKKATETATTTTQDAPTITTASDLDKASTVMDQTELESSNTDDLSELDKELAEF
jgi:Tfp pilus assembly protein PilE